MADGRDSQRYEPGHEQVAGVYAKALVGAARGRDGQLTEVMEDVDSLRELLGTQPEFAALLASGLVDAEDKKGILDRTLGGRVTPLFLDFLKVTADHGRLGSLKAICRLARRLYDEIHSRFEVEVSSAAPLDEGVLSQLSQRLQQMLGGEARLVQTTDPNLIGGLVVRVGDTVYDGSVATRLEQVRRQMINRSVHEIQRGRDRFSHPAGD